MSEISILGITKHFSVPRTTSALWLWQLFSSQFAINHFCQLHDIYKKSHYFNNRRASVVFISGAELSWSRPSFNDVIFAEQRRSGCNKLTTGCWPQSFTINSGWSRRWLCSDRAFHLIIRCDYFWIFGWKATESHARLDLIKKCQETK